MGTHSWKRGWDGGGGSACLTLPHTHDERLRHHVRDVKPCAPCPPYHAHHCAERCIDAAHHLLLIISLIGKVHRLLRVSVPKRKTISTGSVLIVRTFQEPHVFGYVIPSDGSYQVNSRCPSRQSWAV
jgi:hypothetical protein